MLEPIHPGEILKEEFLVRLSISINRLALDIGVPPGRISENINCKRGISADTALRLARFFWVSPELWMGLQVDFDSRAARRAIGEEIETQAHPFAA